MQPPAAHLLVRPVTLQPLPQGLRPRWSRSDGLPEIDHYVRLSTDMLVIVVSRGRLPSVDGSCGTRTLFVAVLMVPLLSSCSLVEQGPPASEQTATVLPASPTPEASVVPASPTPEAPGEVYDRVKSGVVRIETTGCDFTASGSGFLIAPDLVATVAHVVSDARTVSLRVENGVIRGEVVGVDPENEVALIRAVRPLSGHVFTFAEETVDEADPVLVLGYPQGRPLSYSQGVVTGLDRRLDFDSVAVDGLIQHNATSTSGNSGGPALDLTGRVVGLHEAGALAPTTVDVDGFTHYAYVEVAGIKYAVNAAAVSGQLMDWARSPEPVGVPSCVPFWEPLVTVTSRHPDAPGIAASLYRYFSGINRGDYDRAWNQISSSVRSGYDGYEDFRMQQSTSQIDYVNVERASRVDVLTDWAEVTFRSQQASEFGPEGQTCTSWRVKYTLRLDEGYWRIEGAEDLGSPQPCLEPAGDQSPSPTPAASP